MKGIKCGRIATPAPIALILVASTAAAQITSTPAKSLAPRLRRVNTIQYVDAKSEAAKRFVDTNRSLVETRSTPIRLSPALATKASFDKMERLLSRSSVNIIQFTTPDALDRGDLAALISAIIVYPVIEAQKQPPPDRPIPPTIKSKMTGVAAAQDASLQTFKVNGVNKVTVADVQRIADELGRTKLLLEFVRSAATNVTGKQTDNPIPGLATLVISLSRTVPPRVDVVTEEVPVTGPIDCGICSKPFWKKEAAPLPSIRESVHPRITVDYPCLRRSRTGDWWNPWDYYWGTCHSTLDLGVYSFALKCEAGAKLSCCGAEVWGQCTAEACGGPFCLTCTGVVDGGLGASTVTAANTCQYGINLSVSSSCTIDSQTIPLANSSVSPWSVTGPCVPKGCCGR